MSGLGTIMNGGVADGVITQRAREKDDFYPTPPDATRALMDFMRWRIIPACADQGWKVWEPACGDGAIMRVLADEYGLDVVGTDLVDRGAGVGGVDFLRCEERRGDLIITNPPFNLARQFIEKSLSFSPYVTAMLLKSTYFHAAGRYGLFVENMPHFVLPLTWRLDFMGLRKPVMECSWFVWMQSRPQNGTIYRPLVRPRGDDLFSNVDEEDSE